jgi:hypothetical protein
MERTAVAGLRFAGFLGTLGFFLFVGRELGGEGIGQ